MSQPEEKRHSSRSCGLLTDDADDYIDACYAEWLMEQPEAMVTSGDVLVQRMEAQWGWDDFMRHFTGSHQ